MIRVWHMNLVEWRRESLEAALCLQVKLKLNFENHNIQFSSVAVSATIPWQEGKEEDFAELREGLR